MYRITAGNSEWYVARASPEGVMAVVDQLRKRFPKGQVFEVFRGETLLAISEFIALFDDADFGWEGEHR